MEFSSNLDVNPPLHKRKAPPHKLKLPIPEYMAMVLVHRYFKSSKSDWISVALEQLVRFPLKM